MHRLMRITCITSLILSETTQNEVNLSKKIMKVLQKPVNCDKELLKFFIRIFRTFFIWIFLLLLIGLSETFPLFSPCNYFLERKIALYLAL